jgi:adenylate kinase
MTGRRVCEACSATYHIKYNPPKNEGICDKCGGKAGVRQDDHPDTVKERLKIYHEKTAPLIDFYGRKGKLERVLGQDEVSETTRLVAQALDK